MNKEIFGKLSKELFVRQINKDLEAADYLFVTRFPKVSSNALDTLRKKLRSANARYRVVKNSLARRAFEGSRFKDLIGSVGGQCGLTATRDDVAKVSKVLTEFATENNTFEIHKAYVDGQIFGLDRINALAKLPTREELLVQVVSGIQSPIRGIVNTLSGVLRNVVNVVDQIRIKKEKS